jgi:GR25 family glycosyltransferase involved in LPS biosynthesis
MNTLPIFIINLKRRIDRKERMIEQLSYYNIKNYEFIEAVDYLDLTDEIISDVYDDKIAQKLQWSLNSSEIACAMSHRKVFELMIKNNINNCIILEDDVILTDSFFKLVNSPHEINEFNNFDVILLGYHTSNKIIENLEEKNKVNVYKKINIKSFDSFNWENDSVAYFDNESFIFRGFNFFKFNEQSYKVDYLSGAYSYIVNKNFAKLNLKNKIIVEADCLWNHMTLRIFGHIPPMVDVNKTLVSDMEKFRIKTNEKKYSNKHQRRISNENFGK